MSHQYELLTVGPITMDFLATGSGTDFAAHPTFAAAVGGNAATIAIGAVRLGVPTLTLSAVGDDRIGDLVVRGLHGHGVVTDFVFRKPDRRTPVAVLSAPAPGDGVRSSYGDRGSGDLLTVDDFGGVPLDAVRAVAFSGSAFAPGYGVAMAHHAAHRARETQLISFLDMDLDRDRWESYSAYGEAMRAVLPHVDIAVGTERELYAALMPDPDTALRGDSIPPETSELHERIEAQLEQGMLAIAMTRGRKGVTVIRSGDLIDVPGFPVSVVAALGAGEAFTAGLIRTLLRGHDWWDSARYANACGALAVSHGGGAAAFPTGQGVEKFVSSRGGW